MSSTTIYDEYYDDDYDAMSTEANSITGGPNTTHTKPDSSNASSQAPGPQWVNEPGTDEFMFHAMYAVCGVVGFIILATAVCFVYRSRKRANLNIRRIRPRSRPGVLSLELIERDLIQSGLPHPASQPLYGIESVENTELSDISSSVVRVDSYNRNTRTRKHSEENGATPNMQELANHVQKQFERLQESIESTKRKSNESADENRESAEINSSNSTKDVTESTENKSNDLTNNENNGSTKNHTSESSKCTRSESTKNKSCESTNNKSPKDQNRQTDMKRALQPPNTALTRERSFQQRPSPASVKRSPSTPTKPPNKTKVNKDDYEGGKDVNAEKAPLIAALSNASSEYENPDGIVPPKPTAADNNDMATYVNTTVANSEMHTAKTDIGAQAASDIKMENSKTFIFDIDISVPPPSPCKSDVGSYVNAPKQPDTVDINDSTMHVPGYVNVPKLTSSARDTDKDVEDGESMHYENVAKKKTPKLETKRSPPPTSCKPIYVNAHRAFMKKGYSTSFLPKEKTYETCWEDNVGNLDYGYMRMGECQDNNEYMIMGTQENEYLDMSGAGGGAGDFAESEARDCGQMYVNSPGGNNNGLYAVPRMNVYKTVGGNARPLLSGRANLYKNAGGNARCATGRSRSTDDIYDYADMRTIKMK